ncbi:hypothetical protein [Microbacterium sp. MPKO10]|uniref:hypothetical protein n=1 Tax=Microbacterium sp. MPKO10 TaxID=2989818 RepID=UPI0022357255|nr:hypothetical protein [Microbacterium sp. MPKO10]MCW4458206.1 hypothetical protein [Microbacterium sp. MPKO10]
MTDFPDTYTDDTGNTWFWDGRTWVETPRVNSLPEVPAGAEWRVYDSEYWRWWTGVKWSDVYSAKDRHVDLLRRIGQDIVSVYALGGVDAGAIALLRNTLTEYPPVRIVTMTPYTSSVLPGTNLVAVVEWDGPKETVEDTSKSTDTN